MFALRLSKPRRSTLLSLAVCLAATLAMQVLPSVVSAATSTFTAAADTYTRSDTPDTNYGTNVRISTQNRSGEVRVSYLRFNVQVPSGSVVSRATLKLTANGNGTSTGVDLRAVADNSWGETTLTYRNAPGVGSTAVAHAGGYADNAIVSLDATPLVRGSGVVSMALTTASEIWHGFDSREASNGRPQLVVETVAASTTTTTMASTSSVTANAVADTYGQSSMPDSNFGTSTRISAQNRSDEIRRAYLRFNVQIPAGAVVTKATLKLTANGSGTSTGVDVRAVGDNSWGETTLTSRNAPAVGATVIANAGGYSDNAIVSLDVTPLVSGAGLVSMALTTQSPTWHGFDSREASSGKPQLVVQITSSSTSSSTTTSTTAPSTTTTTIAPPPGPSPAPVGALHSTPTHAFVDANGNEVRMRGLNVIPVWASSPGQTWDVARYQQIRDKGFNVVRFVLYWDDFEPSRGVWNQTSLTTLDTAIARAKSAGLYVMLDMIHLWGSGGFNDVPGWARTGDSVTTVQTNGAGYLKMLAGRYRNEPFVAAYDLVNEFYRSPIDQNGVLRAYDSLITAVRSVDPNKIVMIEPSYGDSSIAGSLADFSNLTHRSNVVWSLHDYFAGGDDDGYAADGSQTGTYLWDGTTGYSSPNLTQLEAHLKVHVDKTRAAGIPMWIGEFGIGSGVANHDLWIDHQVSLFNKYGLGYAWWEYYTSGPLSAVNSDYSWKPWVDRLLTGGTTPPPSDPTPPPPPPPSTGDIVLGVVGDTNPSGSTSTSSNSGLVAASMKAADLNAIAHVGDWQYTYGSCSTYVSYWDRVWGSLMGKIVGTAGPTHDWTGASDLSNYRNHTGGTCSGQTTGPALSGARGPDESYVVDLGKWRVISVSSGLWRYDTTKANAQTTWLRNELAAARAGGDFVIGLWHEPYWTTPSSGHGATTAVRPWIQEMYAGGARIVLSGHQHGYERFHPQTGTSTRDDRNGVQQFVVGTGGIGFYSYSSTVAPNSATRQPVGSQSGAFGWLKLTLHGDGSYNWDFVRTSGSTFSDSGFRAAP